MSAIDINELRRLAQAATPGPWHATKSVETNSWAVWSDTTRLMELRPTKTVDMYRVSNTAAFIAAGNPAAISELLDRLEAAEKAVTEAYQRGYATGQEEIEKERDALRARIEQMERQEPTYLFRRKGFDEFCTCSKKRHDELAQKPLLFEVKKLYALPGARPAPSVPREAIDKMLTQLMDIAVSNGANSISMPDEYVEVAAWLCGIPAQPAPSISPAALRPVIQWLRNGCDPAKAADELEMLAAAPKPEGE